MHLCTSEDSSETFKELGPTTHPLSFPGPCSQVKSSVAPGVLRVNENPLGQSCVKIRQGAPDGAPSRTLSGGNSEDRSRQVIR